MTLDQISFSWVGQFIATDCIAIQGKTPKDKFGGHIQC